MIVADKFGVSPDDVEVLHSDTAVSPLGLDTYGSRSLAVGGVAVEMAADKVLDKARTIAAHQLEVQPRTTSSSSRGEFRVKGTPTKAMALAGRRASRRSPPTTSPTAWSPTSPPT